MKEQYVGFLFLSYKHSGVVGNFSVNLVFWCCSVKALSP
jgi:hypothetical protein